MKKIVLVLGLGLAMMSCSKEEVPVIEVQTCGELGYTIIGFTSKTVEGYQLYSIEIRDWSGGTFDLGINKDRWEAYKLEKELNGIACWGV